MSSSGSAPEILNDHSPCPAEVSCRAFRTDQDSGPYGISEPWQRMPTPGQIFILTTGALSFHNKGTGATTTLGDKPALSPLRARPFSVFSVIFQQSASSRSRSRPMFGLPFIKVRVIQELRIGR